MGAYTHKQMLVIRRDLKMRQGKAIAQGSHASGEFMRQKLLAHLDGQPITLSKDEIAWLINGTAKITVRVESEAELLEIVDKARAAGIVAHTITDAGHTEFHGVPTLTAAALGPAPAEILDLITGHLKPL